MTPADLDALIERLQRRRYGAMDDDQCRSQAAAALVQLREEISARSDLMQGYLDCWRNDKYRAERAEAEVAQLNKLLDEFQDPVWQERAERAEARLAWRDEAQITHYEGCWRNHYGCAMERIKALEGERDALQKNCTALVQMFELAAAIPSMSDEQLRELVANSKAAIDAAKEKP